MAPARARPHPRPHLLDIRAGQASATSLWGIQPARSLSTGAHLRPGPPPIKVQAGMEEAVTVSDIETEKEAASHPDGQGSQPNAHQKLRSLPKGGTQPHSADQESEAKPQSNLLKATSQAQDKSLTSPGTGLGLGLQLTPINKLG